MKINDLFFELSHEGRYKLLISIAKGRKKHTHLEKELDLTGPEVSRHLKRLYEEKLIRKSADGYYEITSYGKVITIALPYFENCINFMDFINSHNFGHIPPEILLQIGALREIELRTTTMENIELWTSLITNSQQYIYAITDQLQRSIIPILQKKLQSGTGLEIKAVIDKELFKKFTRPGNLPSDANVLLKQFNIFNNLRISEELNISIIITDLGAIIFLKTGDTIDYDQCIFGKTKRFIKWSKKLFELFWSNAKPVSSSDLPDAV
ncbi:MAG: helix-turn-helix transcriptional regulator [Candidatus Helarchaeota archaeon]